MTFSPAFTNGVNYVLTVNNLEDLAGNMIVSPSTSNFFYFVPDVPTANDVIITEFVCDPSPSVGLPEVEYVELYNRSTKTFDLSNWSISDASASANFSTYTLLPGEYVLITALGEGAQFFVSNYTELSLPSLNNSGDAIVIKDDFGNIIDSIYYSDDWYQDAAKYEGGWSIERKHLDAPCNDINNWSASTNIIGGTPAIQNSIWTDQDDLIPPFINDYTVISDSEVLIEFSELLDTSVIAMATITPSVTTLSWQYTSENELTVYPSSLTPGVLYSLNVSSVQDCWSNVMSEQSIIVGLPDSLEAEDLIINEVMFNPLTNGSDYVEIYNNSNKILDLQEVYLANWDDDSIANYKSVTSTQRLIFPQDYILITEDTLDIINDFSIYGLSTMVEADDIPTYPNDSGTVYLLSKDFNVIDYFHYDEDYHFELLSTNDGKALERITFGGGVNNSDNWRTAAENVEWGTPGYQNSQLFKSNLIGEVTVDPQMFSPDSDGYNDVLIITLDLQSTENVVDIEIYDNHGRLVVQLQDNFFIGNQAMFTWDGIADSGEKALIGTYIVLISVIDIEGEQSQYKKAVVLAGNL